MNINLIKTQITITGARLPYEMKTTAWDAVKNILEYISANICSTAGTAWDWGALPLRNGGHGLHCGSSALPNSHIVNKNF